MIQKNRYAVTTVTNDLKYTENLELVRRAWERVGVRLLVGIVTFGNEDTDLVSKFPNIDFINIILPESYRKYKATYSQSLRFWMASNYSPNRLPHLEYIITDADILPIDKDHFTFELDGMNDILHLNAVPYFRFDKPQFPACYYSASKSTFHRYFPRDSDPMTWLKSYLTDLQFGRDEFDAARCIAKIDTIRTRFINAKFGQERYTIHDEGKDLGRKIIDFHFSGYSKDEVERIYYELTEGANE